MNKLALIVAASAMLNGTAVWAADAANDAAALAKQKHCYACHDDKLARTGPAFRDVARRYSNFDDAPARLTRVIQTGTDTPATAYHWGPKKMPPKQLRVTVSEDEARRLAEYVLSKR